MATIVIPAHNEAAVIGRCLDAVLTGAAPGEFDVVVAANGCTDATVAVARSRGVRVLDLAEPGKARALNAAEAGLDGFPRIYLDADVVVPAAGLRALVEALRTPGPDGAVPLAVAPRRELVTAGRPLPVRAYFAIHARLPVFEGALFGRGVVAVSRAGRARFTAFPDLVADDLFLDGLFGPAEKAQVDGVTSRVETPLRTDALVSRLARVRRANVVLRAAAARGDVPGARDARPSSWLRDVVLRRPWLAPAAVGYVALTLLAARRARTADAGWERDDTTRPAPPTGPEIRDAR